MPPARLFDRRFIATALVATACIAASLIANTTLSPFPWSPLYAALWNVTGSAHPVSAWPFAIGLVAVATAALLGPLALSEDRKPATEYAFRLCAWLLFVATAWAAIRTPDVKTPVALLPYLELAVILVVACAARADERAAAAAVALGTLLLASSVLLDAEGLWGLPHRRQPGGFTGNRNFAGEYLAVALPIVWCTLDRRWTRWAMPLVGAALVLTRCRTAWIAAALGVVALMLWDAPARRRRMTLSLFAAGVVAALLLPNRLRWAEDNPYLATAARLVSVDEGSGAVRLRQYRRTLAALANTSRWVDGFGPGHWRHAVALDDPDSAMNYVPHSDYLRYLCETGIFGLFGFVGMLASLAIAGRRARAWPWLASLLALAVVSLADFPLARVETMVLFGVLAAVLAPSTPR